MISAHNISREVSIGSVQPLPLFWVRATQPIEATGRTVFPGDHLLIDPRIAPTEGRLVLIGGVLARWDGRPGSEGVAIQLETDAV